MDGSGRATVRGKLSRYGHIPLGGRWTAILAPGSQCLVNICRRVQSPSCIGFDRGTARVRTTLSPKEPTDARCAARLDT